MGGRSLESGTSGVRVSGALSLPLFLPAWCWSHSSKAYITIFLILDNAAERSILALALVSFYSTTSSLPVATWLAF